MAFKLDDSYKSVAERIADFLVRFPEGCLQPTDPARPYWLETVGSQVFVVYSCSAYRNPTDPRPGIGLAWEPFPGPTTYTKDSELQNAETAAQGRAIVACGGSEARRSVASADEVRNSQARQEAQPDGITTAQWEDIKSLSAQLSEVGKATMKQWAEANGLRVHPESLTSGQATAVIERTKATLAAAEAPPSPTEDGTCEQCGHVGPLVTWTPEETGVAQLVCADEPACLARLEERTTVSS